MEDPPHHRRSLEHGAFTRAQPVQPGGKQGGDSRWEVGVDIEARVLGEHGQQLLEEQRVALRRAGEPLAQVGREKMGTCQVPEQDVGLARVQW